MTLTAILLKISIYLRMAWAICRGSPYKLTFMVAEGCNLKCEMCSIWESKLEFIELAVIERAIINFPGKLCWINLSGGEVTTHPQFYEIIKMLEKYGRGNLITIASNGNLPIPQKIIEYFKVQTSLLIYYTISIDGFEKTHDKIRGRAGVFKNAMKNLELLKKISEENLYFKVGTAFTLSQTNIDEAVDIVSFCVKKFRNVNINLLQSSDYYANTLRFKKRTHISEQEGDILKRILNVLPVLSLDTIIKVIFLNFVSKTTLRLPCKSIDNHLLISRSGKRKECTLYYNDVELDVTRPLTKIQLKMTHSRLKEAVSRRGCEANCLSPCEKYVHIISTLLNPSYYLIYSSWYFKFLLDKFLLRLSRIATRPQLAER